jgi:hypothetical protein
LSTKCIRWERKEEKSGAEQLSKLYRPLAICTTSFVSEPESLHRKIVAEENKLWPDWKGFPRVSKQKHQSHYSVYNFIECIIISFPLFLDAVFSENLQTKIVFSIQF